MVNILNDGSVYDDNLTLLQKIRAIEKEIKAIESGIVMDMDINATATAETISPDSEATAGVQKRGTTLDFSFGIPRGQAGQDGQNGVTPVVSATATVDNTTGTPEVTVTKTGTDEAPNLAFAFSGLKGQPADDDSYMNSGVQSTNSAYIQKKISNSSMLYTGMTTIASGSSGYVRGFKLNSYSYGMAHGNYVFYDTNDNEIPLGGTYAYLDLAIVVLFQDLRLSGSSGVPISTGAFKDLYLNTQTPRGLYYEGEDYVEYLNRASCKIIKPSTETSFTVVTGSLDNFLLAADRRENYKVEMIAALSNNTLNLKMTKVDSTQPDAYITLTPRSTLVIHSNYNNTDYTVKNMKINLGSSFTFDLVDENLQHIIPTNFNLTYLGLDNSRIIGEANPTPGNTYTYNAIFKDPTNESVTGTIAFDAFIDGFQDPPVYTFTDNHDGTATLEFTSGAIDFGDIDATITPTGSTETITVSLRLGR